MLNTNTRQGINLIKDLSKFFGQPKRQAVLKRYSSLKITDACLTRWSSTFKAGKRITLILHDIHQALESISNGQTISNDLKQQALDLRNRIENRDTIFSFILLDFLGDKFEPVIEALQSTSINFAIGIKRLETLIKILRNNTNNSKFQTLFDRSKELWESMGVIFKLNRSEITSGITLKEKMLCIFNELMKKLIIELESRVTPQAIKISAMPIHINELRIDEIPEFLVEIMPGQDSHDKKTRLETEIEYAKELGIENLLDSSTIQVCESERFKNLGMIAKYMQTLPASNAQSERSFSALRRILTWLRSSMSESRLSDLITIQMNKDKLPDVDKIIEEFKKKDRR